MSTLPPDSPCPCGSHATYCNCCAPFIEGKQLAPTAEALMRSRYTAHCILAIDYLWDTWEKEARRGSSKADIRYWAENSEWLGLSVIKTTHGQVGDPEGTVEFIATYRANDETVEHHEVSQFRYFKSGWRYLTDIK